MDQKMLIGGCWADASDKKIIDDINPFSEHLIGTVPSATKEDVDKAIELAVEGQQEWSMVPLYRRIEIFDKYRQLITDHREELARLMTEEGGKLYKDSLGEIDVHGYIFRAFAEGARNQYGLVIPDGLEPRVEKDLVIARQEPLGVIACIIPYNYPAELFAHKVAPALITGNAVIIKPASDTPMSAICFAKLLVEAGVVPNAVQVVTGNGSKIGDWITENSNIAAISLTGSTPVGAHIMNVASSHVPHVYLELGGNDPFIIMNDCDLDRAVEQTIGGRISNAGQTCCAAKRILVQKEIQDAYIQKLLLALQKLKCGDPFAPDTDMGPIINKNRACKAVQAVELSVSQGANCIFGGHTSGAMMEPTVLSEVTPAMDVANNLEIFGPVIPIIKFDTIEEAIMISNQSHFGLHAGIMTENIKTALRVGKELQCGCVVINGCGNYRTAHQAFGGCKMTGTGREGISYTLNEMTRTKTIAFSDVYN